MQDSQVFISYTHDSDLHKNIVAKLKIQLWKDGVNCTFDGDIESPPEGWPLWCETQIQEADYVLIVCTETYLRRYQLKEDSGKGLGGKWEGYIIRQHLYDLGTLNEKYIPIIFNREDTKYIPIPLEGVTNYNPTIEKEYVQLYSRITGQISISIPAKGKLRKITQKNIPPLFGNLDPFKMAASNTCVHEVTHSCLSEAPHIDLSRLPRVSSTFYGRFDELSSLDKAWFANDVSVALIVSFGGFGKSSLVTEWLKQNRELSKSFMIAWSFYRQGTYQRDSADEFSEWILAKFGYTGEKLPRSRWERGELIANCIRKERGILVLDGLEPLQDQTGRIRDDCIRALLRAAVSDNNSLIIVTSRLEVSDLADSSGNVMIPLGPLDLESGIQLLLSFDILGTREELAKTITDFDGHPLALRLLSGLLQERYRGDVRRRYEITALHDSASPEATQAERVLRAYEEWIKGSFEHTLLRLVGLFDRPCKIGEFEVLTEECADELSLNIPSVASPAWNSICNRLLKLGLLTSTFDSHNRMLDTHPLIRAYFGVSLQADNSVLWHYAHRKLFNYYSSSIVTFPEMLSEGLSDLYSAVRHGCFSGDYVEAFKLYWDRILRGFEYFSTYKICAFTLELSALTGFFEKSWSKTAESLSKKDSARVQSQVGYCLRAIGSLEEALTPLRQSSVAFERLSLFSEAAISQGNYARTLLPLGRLLDAEHAAKHAIELADKADVLEERADKRTILADIFHQLGRFKDAEVIFLEAEALLGTELPSFAGARYCEFLLTIGQHSEARRRALDIKALAAEGQREHLLFGLVCSYAAAALLSDQGLQEADDAIHALRLSGRQDYLAHGLSIRAHIARNYGVEGRANADIEEAFDLVRRYKLDLYRADLLIEAIQLDGNSDLEEKQRELKALIQRTSYYRRTNELPQ